MVELAQTQVHVVQEVEPIAAAIAASRAGPPIMDALQAILVIAQHVPAPIRAAPQQRQLDSELDPQHRRQQKGRHLFPQTVQIPPQQLIPKDLRWALYWRSCSPLYSC